MLDVITSSSQIKQTAIFIKVENVMKILGKTWWIKSEISLDSLVCNHHHLSTCQYRHPTNFNISPVLQSSEALYRKFLSKSEESRCESDFFWIFYENGSWWQWRFIGRNMNKKNTELLLEVYGGRHVLKMDWRNFYCTVFMSYGSITLIKFNVTPLAKQVKKFNFWKLS